VALLGDLEQLLWSDLKKNVRPSGLVSAERMIEIYEEKMAQADAKLAEGKLDGQRPHGTHGGKIGYKINGRGLF
jgi:hypothetical protein